MATDKPESQESAPSEPAGEPNPVPGSDADATSDLDADLAAQRKKRKGPTLDLTATEIERDPAQEPHVSRMETEPSDATAKAASGGAGGGTTPGSGAGPDTGTGAPPPPPPSRARPWSHGIAAIIGALVALAVFAALWAAELIPSQSSSDKADARLAGMESKISALDQRAASSGDAKAIGDLTARLRKLEASPQATPQAAPPADAALSGRLAAVQSAIKALNDKVDESSRRSEAAAQSTHNTAAAQSDIDALTTRLGSLETTVRGLQDQIAQQSARPVADRAIRLALGTAALKEAVVRGDPFNAELATVNELVADRSVLDPLTPFASSGVPNAAALSQQLSQLVPEMRSRVAPQPTSGGSFMERLQANAEKLVRVHPVNAPAGNDSVSVVDRIEIDAAHADIDAALAELSHLPDNARAPAQAWIAKAKARAAALQASRTLAADALIALGKPQAQQ